MIVYQDSAQTSLLLPGSESITSSILFASDRVWIGGSFGLMVYERASKQVVPIANLPAIWFSSILPANDASGDLILNSSIRYYPKTGQWESWSPAADCQDLRYRVFDGMHLLTAFAAATAYTNNDGIVQALPTGSYYLGGPICAHSSLLWTNHSEMDTLYLRWFDFVKQDQGMFKFPSKHSYALFNTQFSTNGSLLLTNTRSGFIAFNRENSSGSRFVNSYHTKSRTAVMLSVAKNLLQGRNTHFTPGQMLHYVQHDTHVGFT